MGGHDIQARMITDSGLSSLDWISNCFGLHLSLSICLQQGRDQKLLNMETEWVHSMERNRIKDREAVRDKEEREQEREGKTYNILWVPERIPPPTSYYHIKSSNKVFFLKLVWVGFLALQPNKSLLAGFIFVQGFMLVSGNAGKDTKAGCRYMPPESVVEGK